MTNDTLTGRCFCGFVRFEINGEVRSCVFCHCESCRRAAGAAFVPWATFAKANFAVTMGEISFRRSSAKAIRGNCERCGTPLTYEHAGRPGEIDVTAVSLDNPVSVRPTAHIWIEDKLPWVKPADGLPQHQTWADVDQ